MKRLITAILLAGLFLTPCAAALADGGYFYDFGEDIYEPSQKAVILFTDGHEDLILSPKYEGTAGDFAWVVPVPARPEVEVADHGVFWELAEITRVHVLYESGGFLTGTESLEAPGVDVLEEKVVGPYDVAVLSSGDPDALVDWLNANGYFFPEAGGEIIAEYVRNGWFFVASRISTGEDAGSLAEGNIEPLVLSFASDRIVYPLRISAISSDDCEVLLYVFSENAVVPGEYPFLTLNTPEQAAYFERMNGVFYVEYRDEIPFGEVVNMAAFGQLLYYLEYGETITPDEYWDADDETVFSLEEPFLHMNYLTKLRAEISAGDMVDIELHGYNDSDYVDSDGDGWSDAEEVIAGSDPEKMDTDGDGICDSEDAAPLNRDNLPDWTLLVALAASLAIAGIIWLISWRKVQGRKMD